MNNNSRTLAQTKVEKLRKSKYMLCQKLLCLYYVIGRERVITRWSENIHEHVLVSYGL